MDRPRLSDGLHLFRPQVTFYINCYRAYPEVFKVCLETYKVE